LGLDQSMLMDRPRWGNIQICVGKGFYMVNKNFHFTFFKVFKLLSFLLALSLVSCYEEYDYSPLITTKSIPLTVDGHAGIFDLNTGMALLSISDFEKLTGKIQYTDFDELSINDTKLENGNHFDFGTVDAETEYRLLVSNSDSLYDDYLLQFTLLPIVHIEHNKHNNILTDSKILATISVIDPDFGLETTEYCGIEIRGASSVYQPKKSYSIAVRQNDKIKNGKSVSFLGMGNYEKWILDAAFVDPSLMRNRVSFDIWNDMQQTASDSLMLLSTLNKGRFIELFINNQYLGVYCLNERYDDQIINSLQASNESQEAFLYKSIDWTSATFFTEAPDTTRKIGEWAGWEQRTPDFNEVSVWKPLYNFINFVAISSDEVFSDSISSFMYIDQAIDYYIFMNLILGYDNAGKNILLLKSSINQPFYMCPWDLDATWGRDWQGEPLLNRDEVTMHLFNRLIEVNPDQFKEKLNERWVQLRQSVFEHHQIIDYFNRYSKLLLIAGANKREKEKWPNSTALETEIDFISEWSKERLHRLDKYFGSMVK
jgi:spore coat protein H